MSKTKEMHTEVLDHIEKARVAMRKLLELRQDDVTANIFIEGDFDELEKAVRDFGACQLGISRGS
jgi:hypothetical protein